MTGRDPPDDVRSRCVGLPVGWGTQTRLVLRAEYDDTIGSGSTQGGQS